ncbi:hypothetical protein V1477_008409 [Vespula maculifrons]|uniref:Secreted protein n=2 Tax=Vespula TaxID=7451 RepID=A0ABD1ZZE8_VESSQ
MKRYLRCILTGSLLFYSLDDEDDDEASRTVVSPPSEHPSVEYNIRPRIGFGLELSIVEPNGSEVLKRNPIDS